MHPGVVFQFLKDFRNIAILCFTDKRAPKQDEVVQLLKDAEDLFISGVVPIPGLDQSGIAAAIKEIESKL
jgi:hypothetical protein